MLCNHTCKKDVLIQYLLHYISLQLDWFNNLILGLKDGFVVGGEVFYTLLSFMLAVDPLYHLSISKWITRCHLYDRRVQKEGSLFCC